MELRKCKTCRFLFIQFYLSGKEERKVKATGKSYSLQLYEYMKSYECVKKKFLQDVLQYVSTRI